MGPGPRWRSLRRRPRGRRVLALRPADPSRAATCALRGEPFAALVVLDPGHEDALPSRTPSTFELGHRDQTRLEADDAGQRGQITVARRGLPQLGVEPLSDDRLRPSVHTGHLQTQAVFEIVWRGTRRCNVVIRPGSGLRPPHGDEPVGSVRPPRAHKPRRRLPSHPSPFAMRRAFARRAAAMRPPPRPRPASVQVEIRRGPVMPVQADARGFRVRVGERPSQPDVALCHVPDRQGRLRRQATSSPSSVRSGERVGPERRRLVSTAAAVPGLPTVTAAPPISALAEGASRWAAPSWTNQYRLLLTGLAYLLLETMRRTALRGTDLARSQCQRLRLRVLRIGAVVTHNIRTVAGCGSPAPTLTKLCSGCSYSGSRPDKSPSFPASPRIRTPGSTRSGTLRRTTPIKTGKLLP